MVCVLVDAGSQRGGVFKSTLSWLQKGNQQETTHFSGLPWTHTHLLVLKHQACFDAQPLGRLDPF